MEKDKMSSMIIDYTEEMIALSKVIHEIETQLINADRSPMDELTKLQLSHLRSTLNEVFWKAVETNGTEIKELL